jgi:hemerythrin-like domain-containing protein
LKGITRSLSPQEHKTASQVSNFLQQARDALRNQDVDAAHTLATKAKLLLDELLK